MILKMAVARLTLDLFDSRRDGEDVGVDCLVLVHKKVESVLYLHLVFQRAMHRQPNQMDLKQLG